MINTSEHQCSCICHRKGYAVRHCAPCCTWTNETFRDENGEILPEKVDELLKQEADEKRVNIHTP